MGDSLDDLLAEVKVRPGDAALRERAARAATQGGRLQEASDLLGALVNVTAHDGGPLPCLCRRCLVPSGADAEVQGQRFRRDFSVSRGRVLYFWLPLELVDGARGVERSVGAMLNVKLGRRRRRRSR